MCACIKIVNLVMGGHTNHGCFSFPTAVDRATSSSLGDAREVGA